MVGREDPVNPADVDVAPAGRSAPAFFADGFVVAGGSGFLPFAGTFAAADFVAGAFSAEDFTTEAFTAGAFCTDSVAAGA